MLLTAFVIPRLMVFLLGGATGLSLESAHSLRYYYLGLSKPSQGRPWFTQDGYVDDKHIAHYDSKTRKDQPQFLWVKNVEEEDESFWERESEYAREAEESFKEALLTLQERYNHSGGLHTWQCSFGCELDKTGSRGAFMQLAYDGKDFISLELETPTWIAGVVQAQETKKKWESNGIEARFWKSYLEKDCIVLLQKYLDHGKEALLRKEPPKMTMISKMDHDNKETIICRIDGFYPKDIHVVWKKDGEVWEQETRHGVVVPNSDGTYHTWASIKIGSEDKNYFQCCMAQSSLKTPLDFSCIAMNLRITNFIMNIIIFFFVIFFVIFYVIFFVLFSKIFCKIFSKIPYMLIFRFEIEIYSRTPGQGALEREAERIRKVTINDYQEDRARFEARLYRHRCTSMDDLPKSYSYNLEN